MATSNSFTCDIAKFRRFIPLTVDIHAESSSTLILELMDGAFQTNIPIAKLMERRIDGPDSAFVPAGTEQPFIVTKFERSFFVNKLRDKMRSSITNNFPPVEKESGHADGWTSKNNGIDTILNDSTVHAIIHHMSYEINTTKDLYDALKHSYTTFKYRKEVYSHNHGALIAPDLKFTLRIGTIYHRHNEDKQFDPLNLYCYTRNFNLVEKPPLNLERFKAVANFNRNGATAVANTTTVTTGQAEQSRRIIIKTEQQDTTAVYNGDDEECSDGKEIGARITAAASTDLLHSTTFDDEDTNNSRFKAWKRKYDVLQKYVKSNSGSIPVRSYKNIQDDGFALGDWISQQKCAYRNIVNGRHSQYRMTKPRVVYLELFPKWKWGVSSLYTTAVEAAQSRRELEEANRTKRDSTNVDNDSLPEQFFGLSSDDENDTLPYQINFLSLSLPKSTPNDDDDISNDDRSSSLDTQPSDVNEDLPMTSNKDSSDRRKRLRTEDDRTAHKEHLRERELGLAVHTTPQELLRELERGSAKHNAWLSTQPPFDARTEEQYYQLLQKFLIIYHIDDNKDNDNITAATRSAITATTSVHWFPFEHDLFMAALCASDNLDCDREGSMDYYFEWIATEYLPNRTGSMIRTYYNRYKKQVHTGQYFRNAHAALEKRRRDQTRPPTPSMATRDLDVTVLPNTDNTAITGLDRTRPPTTSATANVTACQAERDLAALSQAVANAEAAAEVIANKADMERNIMCGRGKAYIKNRGNIQYMEMIKANIQPYLEAKTTLDRTAIIASLLQKIATKGARFIKKDPNTKEWYIISQDAAHDKIGHSIRDMIKNQKREST